VTVEPALPPPPPPPDAAPRGLRRTDSRRVFLAGAIAVLVILTGVTAFWYVTRSGPFATIEPSQWALDMTQATTLHGRGLTGRGVTVCLVDSGIDLTHPELQAVDLVAWRDFVGTRTEPYDDEGHGTAMAAILFARAKLSGVAPDASLVVAKAISASGSGTDAGIANAIRFCEDPDGNPLTPDGADVLSLSLGGQSLPFVGSLTENAVNFAMDRGVIVVAAAGNDGGPGDNGDVESPASVERVIAVGAVNRQGEVASWSSIGRSAYGDPSKKPEVVAPGVSIATALPNGGYAYVSGTSPATALVAGVVALLLEEHAQYQRDASRLDAFKTALMYGACGCTAPVSHDAHGGYGIARGVGTGDLLLP